MQNHKVNLNTLYLSDKLQAELRMISRCPLTLVVAPMGYGKTTAVNWYLDECAQVPGTKVLRINVYSNSLPMPGSMCCAGTTAPAMPPPPPC